MKKLFFLFCIISCVAVLQAQNNLCSLQIKTDDKPSLHGFSYWQQIKVVSKDTSFTYRLHTGNPDVIANLKPGTYKVAVTSVFNHYISKKIELNKKTPLIKFAGLTTHYIKPKTAGNLSDKLKLNDTLFVITSNTQNENTKEKLGITKTKIGYTVIQYKGITNEVFQEMMINDATYKAVPKFESEGKKANSPKAETAPAAEIDTIELNKEITTFIVAGKWEGFNGLKAVLLAVEGK
jgi:hypothetical protein